MTRYTVVPESESDGGYVASVPALPGCANHGITWSSPIFGEAIELYIDDCREAGDPIPTEAGRKFVEVEAALWPGFRPTPLAARFVPGWKVPVLYSVAGRAATMILRGDAIHQSWHPSTHR